MDDILFKLTETGLYGQHGALVMLLVKMDIKLGLEPALIRHQRMAALTVSETG
jgi:hypothetical protein